MKSDKIGVPTYTANEIELKAQAVLKYCDKLRYNLQPISLDIIIKKILEQNLVFIFDEDLGIDDNQKIRGKFLAGNPSTIYLDKKIDPASIEGKLTIAHEIGHYVLHRNMRTSGELISEITFNKSYLAVESLTFSQDTVVRKTAADWMEWHAFRFMISLLLPEKLFRAIVITLLRKEESPNNFIFVDSQPCNKMAMHRMYEKLTKIFSVPKWCIEYRLKELALIKYARSFKPYKNPKDAINRRSEDYI